MYNAVLNNKQVAMQARYAAIRREQEINADITTLENQIRTLKSRLQNIEHTKEKITNLIDEIKNDELDEEELQDVMLDIFNF